MSRPRLDPGVVTYDRGTYPTFVGVHVSGTTTRYRVGAYGFSSPFSANTFNYLFRRCGAQVAIDTVTDLEKRLNKSAAAKFKDFVKIDWKEIVSGNPLKMLDWKGMVEDMATKALGSALQDLMLEQQYPEYNRYDPTSKLWREEYINYGLKYWAKFPSKGPAYKLLRDVAPKGMKSS